jgi:sigma-E factor negative regulatory protein RseA
MTNSIKESLSAMLDNEAEELEIRRVLKSMETDSEHQACWERYNLAQAALHNQNIKPLNPSLVHSIAKALEQEPVYTHGFQIAWKHSLTKFAVAASVAVAVFLGMQIFLQPQSSPASLLSENSTPEPIDANTQAAPLLAISESQQVDPEARQRLEDYIRSVSITREEPPQLQALQDSPLFRLVNEVQDTPQ